MSEILTLKNKDEILSNVKNGFGIFWLKDSIEFAKVKNKNFEFYDRSFPNLDEILSARIFNENKEIYVFRKNDKLWARISDDNNLKKEIDYLDEENTLLGSHPKYLKNDFYELNSQSGSTFIVPLNEQGNFKVIKILKRNYLKAHPDTMQIYYSGFRLIDIKGE